jgi:glutamyl-tRNA reductase
MKLTVYGISHHSCPIAEREHLNFSQEEQYSILRHMHTTGDIAEAMILNTCNRLEFYVYASKKLDVKEHLADIIAKLRPDALPIWQNLHYEHFGINVVRHLFRVAAGLDSQMLGENQIVSQVKSAYAAALECHTSKFLFHRLCHSAFHVGKEVRSQTDINCGAVSVSLAAVELAKRKLSLPQSTAMIIGAGENAELAGKYLLKYGIDELIIANRNTETAQSMAERLKAGRIISLDKAHENLAQVDLVIASTASPEPIVTYKEAAPVLSKRNKPLLIIDIAVPRDVEPQVQNCNNVQLYNIDDLNRQIDANKSKRDRQIPKALEIVDEHVKEFAAWLDSLSMVPVISELTQKMVQMAKGEARRYAADFSGIEKDKLELFAESLAKKFLHGPVSFLKATGEDEPSFEQLEAVNLINKMFLAQEPKPGES